MKIILIFSFFFLVMSTIVIADENMIIGVGYEFFNPNSTHLNSNSHATFPDSGTANGSSEGYGPAGGPAFSFSYLFNESFGLKAAFHHTEVENRVDYSDTYCTNKMEAEFVSLGVFGSIIGDKYPVRLSFGGGIVHGQYKFHQKTTGPSEIYVDGEADGVGFYTQLGVSFPIYKFAHAGIDYIHRFVKDSIKYRQTGSHTSFRNISLGGDSLVLGLNFLF